MNLSLKIKIASLFTVFGMSLLLILFSAVIGCADRSEEPNAATQAEPVIPLQGSSKLQQYGWYQTNRDEASHLLIATLSIPDVFQDQVEEFTIAKFEMIDQSGMIQLLPSSGYQLASADGHNEKGGFGYTGGINLLSDTDKASGDSVRLEVAYSWTTPGQASGTLDEEVSVVIGESLDLQLPNNCRLQISWRKNVPE